MFFQTDLTIGSFETVSALNQTTYKGTNLIWRPDEVVKTNNFTLRTAYHLIKGKSFLGINKASLKASYSRLNKIELYPSNIVLNLEVNNPIIYKIPQNQLEGGITLGLL
ncbi:hypothetical protein [Xanthovirga aplysinae]|uniref:hypothetical protein n=1 Tax=Xanthovirga aplysinae TaxID=2529853 RepID=UPI0012BB5C6C|nr:hypothetical protein [Xanthovirga aplysinae]MTI30733.1 hypothetical protein [Xanthovirga aplysinae]